MSYFINVKLMKIISLGISLISIRNKKPSLTLVQPSAVRPSLGKDPRLSVPFSQRVWLFRENNAVHKIEHILIKIERFCQYEDSSPGKRQGFLRLKIVDERSSGNLLRNCKQKIGSILLNLFQVRFAGQSADIPHFSLGAHFLRAMKFA